MKIHSRFKDYYDYVAHIYGGGDPKIVYDRERIVPPEMWNGQLRCEGSVEIPRELALWIPKDSPRFGRSIGDLIHEYEGLVVAGRWYIVHRTLELVVHPTLKYSTAEKVLHDWSVLAAYSTERYVAGEQLVGLTALSRLVNAPVFRVVGNGWNNQHVQGRVPHLGDLGLAALLPAEQCYQEIAMFLGNTLKINPDEAPESKPPLTNVEKAVAHGFDKKASFRHRR